MEVAAVKVGVLHCWGSGGQGAGANGQVVTPQTLVQARGCGRAGRGLGVQQ